jgi:hypothetical protein
VIVGAEEYETRAEWERHAERVQNDPDFESAIAKFRELADIGFELWEIVELK